MISNDALLAYMVGVVLVKVLEAVTVLLQLSLAETLEITSQDLKQTVSE